MEFNNTNHTVEVGQEISIPSNDTHMVYTVSDTPSCWMYVFFNVTQWNNETIRNWILHPGKYSPPPRGYGTQRQTRRLQPEVQTLNPFVHQFDRKSLCYRISALPYKIVIISHQCISLIWVRLLEMFKPWPNGVASRRKLKTWVYL